MNTTPVLTFDVTSMTRESRSAVQSLVYGREMIPAQAGWDARVSCFADGERYATLHVDRIDGEAQWTVSAVFTEGCSMPRFMNGLFSRCTMPQRPVDQLAALLDEAAETEAHFAEWGAELDAAEAGE